MPASGVMRAPFAAGEIIGGRYRVERIVAEGGMGVIVAAHHLDLEETVAIKFLKEEFAAKPEIVGRFAREAKAAAKIKCEHTATVHDVGISEERGPYIVMEYLEGEDLEKTVQADGRVPYARATELIMQAGEALAVAHANGIVHRDIKPANLFLVKRDHGLPILKVLDFGVSKAAITGNVFRGAISLVKTQSLVGSPIYMSPEQLRGDEDEVRFTSDIWSVGAVLYELLTGQTAFTGNSITELCAAVLETTPDPIQDRAPDVPPALVDAIMRCLEKKAADRWQSIAELVCALAPFAPKRARSSVDRVVAVSKSAGLVRADFAAPTTLSPPPYDSLAAPSRLPSNPLPVLAPAHLVDTQTEMKPPSSIPRAVPTPPTSLAPLSRLPDTGTETETETAPPPRHPVPTRLAAIALAAVALASLTMFFVRRHGDDGRRSAAPTSLVSEATAASPPPTVAPITSASGERPVATEPKPNLPAPSPPKTPLLRARSRRALAASASASASVSTPPPAPPAAVPPPAPAPTDPVRSAIDDRK